MLGGLSRVPGLDGDVILDADVLDVEAPTIEEDEVDEGYVLLDEDEELEKEERKTRASGRLGAGTRTSRSNPIQKNKRPAVE